MPIDMDRDYDYEFLAHSAKPTLIIQGEDDEFGSGERVSAALSPLGDHITLHRVPHGDHFFSEGLDELRGAVRGYYESGPGALVLTGR